MTKRIVLGMGVLFAVAICALAPFGYVSGQSSGGNRSSGGSGTVTHTAGNLTLNCNVVGNGTADLKCSANTVDDGTTFSTSNASGILASAGPISSGANGGAAGVAKLFGSTSGSLTLTAPAAAGTTTNQLLSSNVLGSPAGTAAAFSYGLSGTPGSGFGFTGANPAIGNNGGFEFEADTAHGFVANQGFVYCISGGAAFTTIDTCWSRSAAGVLSIDTNGSGNGLGTIRPGLYATSSNCSAVGTAANPSVASCSAAAAGSFSCATAASTGTCTVNTTAVTANSEILVTQRTDTTTGTRLSVTCNTTIDTVQRAITAVTAATSFTINLGTISTNPECFSYYIIN